MFLISSILASRLRATLLPQRPPPVRRWAEETIVIPDGPHRGSRFDCSVQPFSGLFFDALDSGLYDRIVATGPTQSGARATGRPSSSSRRKATGWRE